MQSTGEKIGAENKLRFEDSGVSQNHCWPQRVYAVLGKAILEDWKKIPLLKLEILARAFTRISTMLKRKLNMSVFQVLLAVFEFTRAHSEYGQFHFVGNVSKEDYFQVLFQTSKISTQVCAAECLKDLDCNAIEMCTHEDTCRLMTGVGPVVSPNSTGNPCQLYLMVRQFSIIINHI